MSQTDDRDKPSSAKLSEAPEDGGAPAAACPCRSHWKLGVLVLVAVMAAMVLAAKYRGAPAPQAAPAAAQSLPDAAPAAQAGLPRLLELGSVSCIPCQMMAPILDQLRKEYAGKLQVDFIDVKEHQEAIDAYRVRAIPTQVFFEPSGREIFRHEGFFPKEDILATWKEFGVDLNAKEPVAFKRLQPAQADTRPPDTVCYMCDGDINSKTLVTVRTDKDDVRLCSPHCYFIMYSCLTEDKADFEKRVSVTDYATGRPVPATDAVYVEGMDAQNSRPWIRAYTDRTEATDAEKGSGGNLLNYAVLQEQELSHRCGFCDRACYPQDAAEVIVGGIHTLGCCSHCALGVAARTGLDIEVHEPDRLTGQMIVVKTFGGRVASLGPESAVAWFGLKPTPDGQWTSAGCFHQGFFATEQDLRTWVGQHPLETGRMITIQQALADKMRLTPQQITKACKIGECAPK